MNESDKAVMKQALDALYSADVDQQSWAKTALMKAIAQPADSSKDAKIAQLLNLLVGDNGALARMERARGWLTNDNPRPVCNWGVLDTGDLRAAIAQPEQPAYDKKYAAKKILQQESGKGVFSMFNACMYKEQCRAAIKQTATKNEQLQEIIAAAYQIAGVYDAPAHVLDVLSSPLTATQEQIDALLPFQIVQPAPQNLQKRLADLHLYEEIAEHYAKCAVSPEALRDWVAAAIQKKVTA